MKKETIQQPERYVTPNVKVKMLRRRSPLLALSLGGDTEGAGDNNTDPYGEGNGVW